MGQPLAAPYDDDPGHAPEEDVGRELDRADNSAADQGDDPGHDHRRAAVEQHGKEQPHGCGWQDVWQDRPVAGDLHCRGRADHYQADQQQRLGAVPDVGPEAPHPGEQHRDGKSGEGEPAQRAGGVRPRVEQAEQGELLERQVVNTLAALDDDLAVADREADRLDQVRCLFTRALGGRLVKGRVGYDERRDQLARERALDGHEASADPVRE